jgi:hypothetical protein
MSDARIMRQVEAIDRNRRGGSVNRRYQHKFCSTPNRKESRCE